MKTTHHVERQVYGGVGTLQIEYYYYFNTESISYGFQEGNESLVLMERRTAQLLRSRSINFKQYFSIVRNHFLRNNELDYDQTAGAQMR